VILVLEGPDGAGKTSIGDALFARLSVRQHVFMVACGPPKGDAMEEYSGLVDCAVHNSEHGIATVFDRLHIGEMVYGPLLRGGSGVDLAFANELDRRLLAAGAVLVHVTASMEQLTVRLSRRPGGGTDPKSGSSLAHSGQIKAAYDKLLGVIPMGRQPMTMAALWNVVDTTVQPFDVDACAARLIDYSDSRMAWLARRKEG
jgi:hypothetical protein